MNILVTGGAGFIGSHVVVELAAAGHRPIILDNFDNSEEDIIARLEELTGQQLAVYRADYQDSAQLEKILASEDIEGVIHFAAYKAVGESVADPLKYYDNNAAGFVRLLQTLRAHRVQNVVFSSSAAVYGTPPVEQVTEETPTAPESPYGWSKRMDEIVLRDLCAAEPWLRGVGLRYFNVVGAHPSAKIGELAKGKPQNLLPIIVQAVANSKPLTVFGTDYPTPDGTCLRDYVHVVDLARAHVTALNKLAAQKNGSWDIYNIGTGKPTSVLELIKTFERINGVSVPYELGQRRPGDPPAYFAVADKAQRVLGWHAEKTTEDAVRDAWAWHQAYSNAANTARDRR